MNSSIITPAIDMKRAHSINSILSKKYDTLNWSRPWQQAFGRPESTGAWLVWGDSANGKTSFVLQLCEELCKLGRVAFVSLEEGESKTLQDAVRRTTFSREARRKFTILNESIEELEERLDKQRAPRTIIIDSFQYTGLSFDQYRELYQRHPGKLFVFTSHAEGKRPSGRTARRVLFDVSLKIWVEGFRAFSKGRYIGPTGHYDIWHEAAQTHWGDESAKTQNPNTP